MAHASTIIRERMYGPEANPRPIDHLIPEQEQVEAIRLIMTHLGQQTQKTPDFVIALEGFEPLAVRFQRFGDVAIYSLLRRRADDPIAELCAVGMLLSGRNAAYDEAVISGVERMKDDSGGMLPFDRDIFRQVRQDGERPMNVVYFFEERPMRDASMRWAARSLAEVFFGMIGVFKPT